MGILPSKDGDLPCYFDEINETEAGIGNSSLRQILNNINDVDANKGKIAGQLPL